MNWNQNLVRFTLALSIAAGSFPVWAKKSEAQRGYDELHDESGKVRPQYEEFYLLWSQLTDRQKDGFLKNSRNAFSGDNALDPLPRVFTGAEYDQVLKPGVEQRARALRAFLQDHYSGRKAYAKSGAIPQDVVDRIIARAYEAGYDGKVRPDQISFFYGPDIIRDEHGVFRVIEDNPGFIGGIGDLRLSYQYIMKAYNYNPNIVRFRDPEVFYRTLAEEYKKRAQKFGGRPVIQMVAPYADQEDKRIQKIFGDYGIETISNMSQKRFLVQKDGVYLQDSRNPGVALEKVGYVVMISEHHIADTSNTQARWRVAASELGWFYTDGNLTPELKEKVGAMLDLIRTNPSKVRMVDVMNLLDKVDQSGTAELKHELRSYSNLNKEAHGLVSAIMQNKVGSNYSPGVDFIGDKEFYVFVEDMIRFYLKEEPILKNIPTMRFADNSGRLDRKIFDKIFSDLAPWVIKKVDGRGGDAVWVGPKVKKEEIADLQKQILADPGMFIVQAFTPLSYMNDNIVDVRVISEVSPEKIIVTDTPWGRGLPKDGNGKVNLSDKGREITVLVRRERAPFCRQAFRF